MLYTCGHKSQGAGLATQEDAYWYVARTQPGATDIAIKSLQRKAIPHLHPEGTLRDGTRYPLIPGYLFVLSAANLDAWAEIKETRGIERLLPVGAEVPCIVPSKHMDAFYARFVNGEFNEPEPDEEKPLWFKKNEKVLVTSGPFTNHIGTFVRSNRGTHTLKIAFLGMELEASFKGHQLSKAV